MKKSDLKKLIAIGAVAAAAAATTAIIIAKRRKDKVLLEEHTKTLAHTNAYITSGGLSAFASALYLIRDCGLRSENVHIFTNGSYTVGNGETGYICRRGKTLSEKTSLNFFDLLNEVSSLDIPDLSVCDEILNIYRANPAHRHLTFIDDDKNVIDISKIKIDRTHRKALMELLDYDRAKLQAKPVHELFQSDFFETPFWKLICAAYGFNMESSAYEFVNAIKYMEDTLTGTIPSDFDRHEEIVEPLKEHLKKLGADVRENAVVTDIDFDNDRAESVHFTDNGIRKTFYLNEHDICIMPTDEMAQCESFGSFDKSAPKLFSQPYYLWEKLSNKNSVFKNPALFFDDYDENVSVEFTVTLSNRMLPELIDKVTCGALGNDGVIVLDNSKWKMTICAVPVTHFKNRSEDTSIIWGSATRFDVEGERCGKPMTDCSGAEILYELVSCLNLDEAWDDIRETVINVIPCHRRYDKSYLTATASKLEIIPTGITNFAVSGDFADYDNGTVFSEEYAVSTARTASYKLMKTKRKVYRTKNSSRRNVNKTLKNL